MHFHFALLWIGILALLYETRNGFALPSGVGEWDRGQLQQQSHSLGRSDSIQSFQTARQDSSRSFRTADEDFADGSRSEDEVDWPGLDREIEREPLPESSSRMGFSRGTHESQDSFYTRAHQNALLYDHETDFDAASPVRQVQHIRDEMERALLWQKVRDSVARRSRVLVNNVWVSPIHRVKASRLWKASSASLENAAAFHENEKVKKMVQRIPDFSTSDPNNAQLGQWLTSHGAAEARFWNGHPILFLRGDREDQVTLNEWVQHKRWPYIASRSGRVWKVEEDAQGGGMIKLSPVLERDTRLGIMQRLGITVSNELPKMTPYEWIISNGMLDTEQVPKPKFAQRMSKIFDAVKHTTLGHLGFVAAH